jgi:hypothetical protein
VRCSAEGMLRAMNEHRLRKERLSWREIGDELVVVDVATTTYLSANASAVLLWRELDRGATHDSLVARLTEEFGIDAGQAAADVDAFLADLETRGLLEPAP